MAMLIDPTARRAALETASRHPVTGFDPGFIERFKADHEVMRLFSNLNADHVARNEVVTDFITRFQRESGQQIAGWANEGAAYARLRDQARTQFETWKKDHPESGLEFPTDERIGALIRERQLDARQRSLALEEQSTSWSSAIGGFLGTASAALRDPVTLMTMGFGAGSASGVVRTALIEGGIGMATETAIQLGTFARKQRVDPTFSADEAVTDILAAGAGGAVLGGGIRGIASLWHRAATGEWPRHVRDAANVVSREAAIPASRLDRSAQGASVYRGAVEKAADDLARGRPVEIPQEAFLQANARPGRVYDADGRSVGVVYEVVEAADLTTSHRDDFGLNPDFPQALQPRDRTRAISQDQVQAIAANLQPERLGPSPQAESGAPIIGPDGLVESGNARVMAMRRVYAQDGVQADNYRAFLRSQNFDIDGMDRPVLVARRVTDMDAAERVGFVTAANRSTALRLGASEQALADARLIDDAVLSKLDGANVDALGNRDFVRGFLAKLPRAEQGELVDRAGVLSQTGERRVMAALMGRAYGDPTLLGRVLEDADSNIKAIGGALGDAAGPWAKMRDAVARGDVPRGMDITADLLEAVRLVMKARDEGRAVRDMVDQAEMFGGPNEIAKIMARAMFADEALRRPVGRARLRAFLADYADEAMKNDAGPRLFGEPLRAPDVLRSSLARTGRSDLEAVAGKRLTPEHVEEMAVADETAEAVVTEAERLRLEHPGLTVDLGDGPRSLDEIFDEADEEIAASADIEACALGRAQEAAE